MLMTAVIVGTMLQIQKDGIMSPHAIFLFAVLTSFTVSALLHPLEMTCMLPFLLYFLAIPCMYMLLPIYSVCNMNTVTWGTREDPVRKREEEERRRGLGGARLELVEAGMGPQADGELSLGCGNACRLLCCLKPDPMEGSRQVQRINETLADIQRQLQRLERKRAGPGEPSCASQEGADTCYEEEDEEEQVGGSGMGHDLGVVLQNEPDEDLDMKRQSQAAKRNRKWRDTKSEAWMKNNLLRR